MKKKKRNLKTTYIHKIKWDFFKYKLMNRVNDDSEYTWLLWFHFEILPWKQSCHSHKQWVTILEILPVQLVFHIHHEVYDHENIYSNQCFDRQQLAKWNNDPCWRQEYDYFHQQQHQVSMHPVIILLFFFKLNSKLKNKNLCYFFSFYLITCSTSETLYTL